jgi:predicted ester cyclase
MLVVLARQRKASWRAEEEASVSVEENNKAVVRRFNEEVYNRGNMDVADELLAPNFVSRDALTGEEAGREDLKREIAEQAAISSDLHFSIEEQIAEGDKVVTRIIGSGTHDLAEYRYRGVSPSGVRITIENISINRVVDGKIVEERTVNDPSPWWQRRMEQERVERERVEQELRVAMAHPARLAPQRGAHSRGVADLPLLPAGQRSRRRLLRLSPPLGGSAGGGCG